MTSQIKQSKSERSKYLSYLLRHKPEKARLDLDKEGWCNLEQLLENTDFVLNELIDIVRNDSKTRFAFDESAKNIRANQGHSTQKVQMTFTIKAPPAKLYHGTNQETAYVIFREGLMPMARHHVHLSADIEIAEIVGARRRPYQILVIDSAAMFADGVEFFISENDVWLVKHVHPKYLSKLN